MYQLRLEPESAQSLRRELDALSSRGIKLFCVDHK